MLRFFYVRPVWALLAEGIVEVAAKNKGGIIARIGMGSAGSGRRSYRKQRIV